VLMRPQSKLPMMRSHTAVAGPRIKMMRFPWSEQSIVGSYADPSQCIRYNERCPECEPMGTRGPNSFPATCAGTPAPGRVHFWELGRGQKGNSG